MIFTERTITVVNDSATINKPLILYRGDKNIELKITIAESQFKFRNTDASNVIETTDASYAQLVINTPYNSPIFSDVAVTKNGAVIFVITEAMIDEIREVGAYEIQIRLLDDNKQSRASIPPVSNAIEIREPIAIEDGSAVDSNAVNVAKVNRALTTTSAPLEAFDSQGNYIKKTWGDGDPITDAALNKMEAGIDGVNKKVANVSSQIKEKANFNDVAKISNGTPLFSNSISGMTDTTRNYVNTTDGYLYVYNGVNFEKTNILYQSSGIAPNSVEGKEMNSEGYGSKNLIDFNALTTNAYLDKNGNENSINGFHLTDFIELEENQEYEVVFGDLTSNGKNGQCGCFYGVDKTFLGGITNKPDEYTATFVYDGNIVKFTVPTGVRYIRINISVSGKELYYLKKVKKTIKWIDIKINNLNDEVKKYIESQKGQGDFAGLKANFLGDSITAGYNSTYVYHEEVKKRLGLAEVRNYGVSGTTMAVGAVSSLGDSFVGRYLNMDNDADIVFVLGGTNDYNSSVPLGTIDSTNNTEFYGALNILCKGLRVKYKGKIIIFATPPKRYTWDEVSKPKIAPLQSYCTAIKEVCSKFGIPVVDLNSISNIYADADISSPYLSDGLHPNEKGHKIMGRIISKFINNL